MPYLSVFAFLFILSSSFFLSNLYLSDPSIIFLLILHLCLILPFPYNIFMHSLPLSFMWLFNLSFIVHINIFRINML